MGRGGWVSVAIDLEAGVKDAVGLQTCAFPSDLVVVEALEQQSGQPGTTSPCRSRGSG